MSLVNRLLLAALLAGIVTAPALAASPAPRRSEAPTAAPVAPVELVEEVEGGRINWTTGKLSVAGVGMPGDRGPLAYRRTLARRDALAAAYRKLAAAIEAVRVDATSRVRDVAVIDDGLRTRLNELVKGAPVLETNNWPDGTVEIVLGVPLTGEQGVAGLLKSGAGLPPVASAEAVASDTGELRGGFSSVIVDARSLGAQPAINPKLREAQPGNKPVSFDGAPSIKYLRDGAELDPMVGISPLRLKASRTLGTQRADLVLSAEATERLKAALQAGKLKGPLNLIVLI